MFRLLNSCLVGFLLTILLFVVVVYAAKLAEVYHEVMDDMDRALIKIGAVCLVVFSSLAYVYFG